MRQPNILMIMADQLSRAGAAAPTAIRWSVRRTWTRLAAQGVVFENAYCNFPLCAPSRASLMTGQLPSRIGVYDNAAEFPASVPTFAHDLRRAGLPHLPRRQDAFRRPRPAARLRGAPDHRHLSRRISAGRPTGTPPRSGSTGGTTTWRRSSRPGSPRPPTSSTSTRRWRSRPSGRLADHVRVPGRTAVLPVRVASPIRTTPTPCRAPTGTATVRTRSIRPRSPALPPDAMDAHSLRLTRVCDMPAAAITDADAAPGAATPITARSPMSTTASAQLLAALEPVRPARRHRRPGHRRPRRHAGRARPLVQDALLRMGAARAAHPERARPVRGAPGHAAGLAGRRAADACSSLPAARPIRRCAGDGA